MLIIGGGVIGTSVAFHLAKLGWTDVVLLEQGTLGCGTTWHAAGLIGQLRANETETKLSRYGIQLYADLEKETGQGTGWKQCGGVTVARTQERMTHIKRTLSRMRAFGIEGHLVSPEEAKKHWPLLSTEGITGALWIPHDGVCLIDLGSQATSSDITSAFAAGAKSKGVKIIENVRVTGIHKSDKHAVTGVSTSEGDIKCEYVVNCGGMWAKQVGRLAGVNVPLHTCEHFYISTKPIDGVDSYLPVLRDPDGYIYFREWSGGIIMGGFEPVAKPCFADGVPNDFQFQLFDEDWDHFSILMKYSPPLLFSTEFLAHVAFPIDVSFVDSSALERCPALETAEVRQLLNGPESFTPDNQYILGEAPEVRNFFVAAGFNSSGIASAAGAGKALSEWLIQGYPTMDLWSVDIRRFGKYHANDNFQKQRSMETLGLHYQAHATPPLPQFLRFRPAAQGFGSKMGWERPNYFLPSSVSPSSIKCEEHKATRDEVALFDQTSFAKFVVKGRHVESFMQRLCANDVAVPVGRVVYTPMLNPRGGYETDCTVTRVSEDSYFVVSSTAQATRDYDWISRNIQEDEEVSIVDVSPQYSTLSLMGPKSRELLSRVIADRDLSNEEVPLGITQVRASRITYVGELGWELYVPIESTLLVYDLLHAKANEGTRIGLRDAGYYAIDGLRLEKGYRAWGSDITPDDTPLEAGLGFAVDLKNETKNFLGKDVLLRQKKEGLEKRLAVFVIDNDQEVYPHGGEPIFRDGQVCGYLTSVAYGHTVGRSVGLGYVRKLANTATKEDRLVTPDWVKAGRYEVEVASKRVPASVSLQPPFDPKNERVRM
ncbi:dehydrogenase [Acanthamoeba castellanii str. Neff]|uniref:Dehydrogenase n=1 Tax=Acanthamoeba castellanii (strain ATCC 30010 / Neff) TaxID=1257118 RepID=L8HF67_ACACF|nr:dehydrogenase [Acanthamoeba castellanii str. Neff]ELR24134.1 dehydrogenase [Acanthamoeba castellanii str. Neff]